MFHSSASRFIRQRLAGIIPLTCRTHSLYPLTLREVLDRKPVDQSITLSGYLVNIRKLKTHYFLDLVDGSLTNNYKHLQVVASLETHPNLPRLTHGCSVNVRGKLVRSTHPKQEYEFNAEQIDLINACDTANYPLSPKVEQTLVRLRPDEHMRLRSPLAQVVFRLRSELMFSLHEYFREQYFVHIQTPCLTRNDCEGGGETFRVQPYVSKTTDKDKEYFNRQVYLTVSGQLHLETAAK
jgi:asparaginyl-tRNA synthetase